MNHQFSCIVFEEKDENQNFKDNKFLGFKRISYSNEFIDNTVQKAWNEIRNFVTNKQLKKSVAKDIDGLPIINKTGQVKTSLNFLKPSEMMSLLEAMVLVQRRSLSN